MKIKLVDLRGLKNSCAGLILFLGLLPQDLKYVLTLNSWNHKKELTRFSKKS